MLAIDDVITIKRRWYNVQFHGSIALDSSFALNTIMSYSRVAIVTGGNKGIGYAIGEYSGESASK
jgi:hypothetical protein